MEQQIQKQILFPKKKLPLNILGGHCKQWCRHPDCY